MQKADKFIVGFFLLKTKRIPKTVKKHNIKTIEFLLCVQNILYICNSSH